MADKLGQGGDDCDWEVHTKVFALRGRGGHWILLSVHSNQARLSNSNRVDFTLFARPIRAQLHETANRL